MPGLGYLTEPDCFEDSFEPYDLAGHNGSIGHPQLERRPHAVGEDLGSRWVDDFLAVRDGHGRGLALRSGDHADGPVVVQQVLG